MQAPKTGEAFADSARPRPELRTLASSCHGGEENGISRAAAVDGLDGGPERGIFSPSDVHAYGPRRWRRVQALADAFWQGWQQHYLGELQARRKWASVRPSLKVGDLVLVRDKTAKRNEWPLGRVESVRTSADGLVRSALIKVARSGAAGRIKLGFYTRPISELVLLMSPEPNDQTDSDPAEDQGRGAVAANHKSDDSGEGRAKGQRTEPCHLELRSWEWFIPGKRYLEDVGDRPPPSQQQGQTRRPMFPAYTNPQSSSSLSLSSSSHLVTVHCWSRLLSLVLSPGATTSLQK